MPGLCFLSLSLLSVRRSTSHPVMNEQPEKASLGVGAARRRRRQWPTRMAAGSREVATVASEALSSSLVHPRAYQRVLAQIGDAFKVVYFLFDGEQPGQKDAKQMVRQVEPTSDLEARIPALYTPMMAFTVGVDRAANTVEKD